MASKPKIYLRTYKRFVDLSLRDPSQIDSEDIAHALSLINRFNGHAIFPYSVAQHCIIGAKYLFEREKSAGLALAFLLHDAHEAYVGDITRPALAYFGSVIKSVGREVSGKMAVWQEMIAERYDLYPSAFSLEDVVTTDNRMLATEREQILLPVETEMWPYLPEPLDVAIVERNWEDVKEEYLSLLDFFWTRK